MADRQRWVIKIGSALLTNDGKGLDCALMQSWVDRMVALIPTWSEDLQYDD